MKPILFLIFSCLLFCPLSYSQSSANSEARVSGELAKTVNQFLSELPDALRKKAIYPFESEERYNWHFVPRARNGVPVKQLNDSQRKAAMAILRKSLSSPGYTKATAIIELESVLKVLENRRPEDGYRDSEKYYFTVFGNPSDKEPWGWRVEGHHLSLNFSSLANEIVSATPMFMGANPAIVPDGPQKGKQILEQEEELARALLQSFSSQQLKSAVINESAPGDIITGNNRRAILTSKEGLTYRQMDDKQRDQLIQLINVYLDNLRKELSDNHWQKLHKAGLENVRFAWAGSKERGKGHYYRILSPTLLIEYDNTQNNANHVHTVVRDLTNDFGEDVLKRHYEQQPHGK